LNSSTEIDFITKLRRRRKHGHKFSSLNLSLQVSASAWKRFLHYFAKFEGA